MCTELLWEVLACSVMLAGVAIKLALYDPDAPADVCAARALRGRSNTYRKPRARWEADATALRAPNRAIAHANHTWRRGCGLCAPVPIDTM